MGIAERDMEREKKVASAYVFPYIHTNTHTQTLDEIKTLVYARYAVCCVFLLLLLFFSLIPFFEGEDS